MNYDKQIQKANQRFDRAIKGARTSFYTATRPKPSSKMLIGINALNGKPVFISEDDRKYHMHIIGTTGAGKSKLMEYMIRCDIAQGRGVCLIDPHGDLYKNILKYLVRKRLSKKVILIDPNDEEWAVGINFLEYDPNVRSSTSHASSVMGGIAKVFGGEDTDVKPRLQRWERVALIPLIERKLTLLELSDFVDPDDSFLRQQVLHYTENYQLLREWQRFDQAPRRDRETYVEAILNRANKFAIGDIARRIFGQIESTIDFRWAIDNNISILCNLACNKLSEEEQRMLGVVIIDKIVQAAKSRVNILESQRKSYYFYLDEFGSFVSPDIAKALWELRKFNVRLILAHQELEQLKEEDRKVYSAVMAEPQIRAAFRSSREDSEILTKEMFTGQIKPKEKRRIVQTKFWPKETTREVETETESWSESDFESSGESSSNSEGLSEHKIPVPAPTIVGDDIMVSYNEISVQAAASSSSTASGSTYGESTSWSTVPFIEFLPFSEVSTIQDFTPEEIIEKYIAWIKNQPDRHAQLKVRQNRVIPILTPFVKDLPVRQKDIQALKEKVYSQYALPAKEADRLIEQRRKQLSEAKREAIEPTTFKVPKKTTRRRKPGIPKE